MRPCVFYRLCLLVILIFPVCSFAEGFKTYSREVSLLKLMLDCSEEKEVPPIKGFGALYICTLRNTKTIKLFVGGTPDSDRVQHIGMIWNHWENDVKHGIFNDLTEAEKALEFLIDIYIPAKKNEIKKVFWNSKNTDFSTSNFSIYFTYKSAPERNQRLILIEEKLED